MINSTKNVLLLGDFYPNTLTQLNEHRKLEKQRL